MLIKSFDGKIRIFSLSLFRFGLSFFGDATFTGVFVSTMMDSLVLLYLDVGEFQVD